MSEPESAKHTAGMMRRMNTTTTIVAGATLAAGVGAAAVSKWPEIKN